MKIRFLGTNGWFDTNTGNTVCILVETKNSYLILDAGNGFYKIGRYIKRDKPIYLFLSHYHLDHVIGLHILNKFNFKQGLDIYGPPGLKALFNKVINKPYSVALSGLSFKLRLHEITKTAILPAGVFYAPLKHSGVCYGYRICLENKVVSYCTDTGVCDNFFLLAKNADLLITECSLMKGRRNLSWPHLDPQQAALVAKNSTVKRLFLVHFDAGVYLTGEDRALAQRAARKIFKNTVAAKDDLSLIL